MLQRHPWIPQVGCRKVTPVLPGAQTRAGAGELNVSPSVITFNAPSEDLSDRHRWNTITPAKMIGETAD
jgi:hypothetical protein